MFQPLEISFLVRGLAFDGDSLTHSSLGGSETAGLCLARELAALGHHVTMFSNCPRPGIYDKVLYRELGAFVDYARSAPHDVTVVQRMPEIFSARYNSRLNILGALEHRQDRGGVPVPCPADARRLPVDRRERGLGDPQRD